jgi:hypothetical protein
MYYSVARKASESDGEEENKITKSRRKMGKKERSEWGECGGFVTLLQLFEDVSRRNFS